MESFGQGVHTPETIDGTIMEQNGGGEPTEGFGWS